MFKVIRLHLLDEQQLTDILITAEALPQFNDCVRQRLRHIRQAYQIFLCGLIQLQHHAFRRLYIRRLVRFLRLCGSRFGFRQLVRNIEVLHDARSELFPDAGNFQQLRSSCKSAGGFSVRNDFRRQNRTDAGHFLQCCFIRSIEVAVRRFVWK